MHITRTAELGDLGYLLVQRSSSTTHIIMTWKRKLRSEIARSPKYMPNLQRWNRAGFSKRVLKQEATYILDCQYKSWTNTSQMYCHLKYSDDARQRLHLSLSSFQWRYNESMLRLFTRYSIILAYSKLLRLAKYGSLILGEKLTSRTPLARGILSEKAEEIGLNVY